MKRIIILLAFMLAACAPQAQVEPTLRVELPTVYPSDTPTEMPSITPEPPTGTAKISPSATLTPEPAKYNTSKEGEIKNPIEGIKLLSFKGGKLYFETSDVNVYFTTTYTRAMFPKYKGGEQEKSVTIYTLSNGLVIYYTYVEWQGLYYWQIAGTLKATSTATLTPFPSSTPTASFTPFIPVFNTITPIPSPTTTPTPK